MTLWGYCLSETGQLASVPEQAWQVAWSACSRAWVWGVRPCGYVRAALRARTDRLSLPGALEPLHSLGGLPALGGSTVKMIRHPHRFH